MRPLAANARAGGTVLLPCLQQRTEREVQATVQPSFVVRGALDGGEAPFASGEPAPLLVLSDGTYDSVGVADPDAGVPDMLGMPSKVLVISSPASPLYSPEGFSSARVTP
jgi:hypothetical protein